MGFLNSEVLLMKAGLFFKKAASLFFVLVLLSGLAVLAYATDDEIEYVQMQKEEDEQELVTTEERIIALEESKSSSEAYLSELSVQLTELTDELISANEQLEEKESELEAIEEEIGQLEVEADEQYEAMKIRIQYLYEAGAGSGTFVSMLSADSFTEFLNRAENYSELNRFDREMLQNYENTLDTIRERQDELLAEKEEILQIKADLAEKQFGTQQLYEAVYHDMMNYISEIDGAEMEYAAIIEEIQAKEELVNELLRQQYEAEVAAALAEQQAAMEALAEQAAQEAYLMEQMQENTEVQEEPAPDMIQPEAPAEQPAEPQQEEAAPEAEALQDQPEAAEGDNSEAEESAESSVDSTDGMTYLGNFTLTAYCACPQCCGAYASGYTASGTYATEGVTVAMGGVDFGTRLCINGHIYTVEDRGTAYGHVDIFFSSHSAALAFGLQHADVYKVNE